MSETALEYRVLVLAPTGRDAELACQVLGRERMVAERCADMATLCHGLATGAGAVLLAEEALTNEGVRLLKEQLARQPPWSGLPVLILTGTSTEEEDRLRMQRLIEMLGNVTLLERPLRVLTLATAVRTALRARARQYAARQALEALAAKAEFEQQLIGIVSHDLRNPLSAMMMGASRLLQQQDLDPRITRTATRILSSGERATRMISDLLDFTKVRLGGGLAVERRPMDLHELTRQIVEEVRLAHPGRGIEIESGGDCRGRWDSDRLAQLITNLLHNALSYSPPETPVRIVTRDQGDIVALAIHNLGHPIPPPMLPSLFEPLQRGPTKAQGASRSIGLGLYIVKHIVLAHEGTVDVRSTQGEGTTFTVHLPREARESARSTPALASDPNRRAGEPGPGQDGATRAG